MILGFIIGGIVIGVLLAPIVAISVIVTSKKNLAAMDELVEQYNDLSPADREANRPAFKKRMMELKAGISTMDTQSIEAARDKVAMI